MPKKGYKQTEEAKKKRSILRLKRKEELGYLNSPETREKLRIANLGQKRSKETCRKISESKKGKKQPNISKGKKGKSNYLICGEKNGSWKGGITPENHKIRNSLEYQLWRRACFERDNFTCQVSGQPGGGLVVHHINNFADFPELRTTISNGITIKKEMHTEFHQLYGKKNNTKEQLEEFIENKRIS